MIRLTSSPRFRLAGRSARAWLLVLGTAPWLIASACSDDDAQDGGPSGSSGSGGASAGTGGDGTTAGTGGGGSGGLGGSAGSAGTSNVAGSSGSGNLPDAGPGPDGGGADASVMGAFTLTSPAVDGFRGCGPDDPESCDLFPDENTNLGNAANVSPEFAWTGVPAGTQSFALALHDLSNLMGQDPFTHWVLWNIPGSATGLPAALPGGANPGAPAPAGSQQVSYNGSGTNGGYVGSGACGNVYEFVLFALATPSVAPGSTNADAVEAAIAGSSDVLGTATLRARSDPNGPSCN